MIMVARNSKTSNKRVLCLTIITVLSNFFIYRHCPTHVKNCVDNIVNIKNKIYN